MTLKLIDTPEKFLEFWKENFAFKSEGVMEVKQKMFEPQLSPPLALWLTSSKQQHYSATFFEFKSTVPVTHTFIYVHEKKLFFKPDNDDFIVERKVVREVGMRWWNGNEILMQHLREVQKRKKALFEKIENLAQAQEFKLKQGGGPIGGMYTSGSRVVYHAYTSAKK